jgi:hypothetical protein
MMIQFSFLLPLLGLFPPPMDSYLGGLLKYGELDMRPHLSTPHPLWHIKAPLYDFMKMAFTHSSRFAVGNKIEECTFQMANLKRHEYNRV